MQVEKFYYDNKIVKAFGIATVVFAIVGMLAGLWVAIQFYAPQASLNLAATTFGRMRPLHTNAIIFAFVGNCIFTGVYYSLQRLCKGDGRRLALACGIDAGKEHDHGKLGVQQLLLCVEELGAQDGDLSLIDFLFEFPSDFGRLEHPSAWYFNSTSKDWFVGRRFVVVVSVSNRAGSYEPDRADPPADPRSPCPCHSRRR